VKGPTVADGTTAKAPVRMAREIPHTVSPGLWALAWKRLKTDNVGMVSLVIVALFVVMMIASGTGLIAGNWSKETGVNYAPPSFLADDLERAAPVAPASPAAPAAPAVEYKSDVVDPLADVLAEIKGEKKATGADTAVPAEGDAGKSIDPLADEMADIRKDAKSAAPEAAGARLSTLPLGADKWGRDVLQKTIKGSETSIFVGLAAAAVATLLGTLFGALAGYYGKWIDDAFNWFYSVFNSIPYLLLILAVAAVLQQKGTLTIILILGLTGWTGTFRLIRGEYLKHKAREYVQAADAIGASNARRMFVHIFPNVSHVVLVQLSIYTVGFIKAEVILSFLGFGVPVDVVSWGSMLNEAQNELILGKWWQLAAAGTAMAILVTAFSLFTDALRDALDPKLKGLAGT
jgi:peptide/nickel transport system permease protein